MKKSAGILPYRLKKNVIEVFLVHPGGPFWKNKDMGAWSIAKGEFSDAEDPLNAAQRELLEETGIICKGPFIELRVITQKSGKQVFGWATKLSFNAAEIRSNNFELEWPPKSGKMSLFPEVDRGEWFTIAIAKQKIIPSQAILIDDLMDKLKLVK